MQTNIWDNQTVGETSSVLFSMIQQGPVNATVIMKNSGVNTMNYTFQQFNGSAWVDMDVLGTDYNNTLSANEVKTLVLRSTYPQVQLVGFASGGALLEFNIGRYTNRASGGPLPLINL